MRFNHRRARSGLQLAVSLTGGMLALLGGAGTARADLTAQFQAVLTVDAEYVTGANNATDIAFAQDGRAVVTRKTGQVVIRRIDGTVNVVNNPFGGMVDTESEKGLLGVAADPNSANTFYFYVSNGSDDDDKHRVYRAILTDTDDIMADPSPVVGAEVGNGPGLRGPANHDGGGLNIHDGMLYVSVGDTGSNSSPPTNKFSSCLDKGNGKILRVGLDGSIPANNPLVGVGAVTGCDNPNGAWTMAAPDERIYAWGFRNPFRFWVDPQTDLLWVGDVGEVTQEEIAVGSGNQHFGYPFIEGDQNWGAMGDVDGNSDCMDIEPARACTPAVHAYDNPGFGGGGAAVAGGLIPSGCGWTDVFGGTYYLFGDANQSWIRALSVNADRTGVTSSTPIDFATYANARPVAFRMGPDESLYVVLHGEGSVYRFTPTSLTGSDCGVGPGTGGAGGQPAVGGGPGVAGAAGAPAVGGGPGTGGAPADGGGVVGQGGTPVAAEDGGRPDDGGMPIFVDTGAPGAGGSPDAGQMAAMGGVGGSPPGPTMATSGGGQSGVGGAPAATQTVATSAIPTDTAVVPPTASTGPGASSPMNSAPGSSPPTTTGGVTAVVPSTGVMPSTGPVATSAAPPPVTSLPPSAGTSPGTGPTGTDMPSASPTATASPSGALGSGGAVGMDAPGSETETEGGCGCRVAGEPRSGQASLLLGLGLLLALRRRPTRLSPI